ncbi:hypothetical protein T09_12680 [Trichinella sp. T9]|nr:hypothetical protein T09_12680 [Trichinella sp. T9]
MKKPRTSVTKCMTLRLLYTSSLTGLLTDFIMAKPIYNSTNGLKEWNKENVKLHLQKDSKLLKHG